MSDDTTAADPLAQMRESVRGTLVERMGIDLVEVTPERVVATMPVEGNTQPYGLLHGGASCALAETVGSVAASLHAPDRLAVGIEINASHHRAVRNGVVTGTATPVHVGRSVAVFDVAVTDARDRRICTARLTCMLVDRV